FKVLIRLSFLELIVQANKSRAVMLIKVKSLFMQSVINPKYRKLIILSRKDFLQIFGRINRESFD
ncbi:MAG: hypothetical protein JWQ28_1296, partial [Pedobacter sp.]|nr:hypothetical protein [Pedobacter sp.]